MAPGPAAERAPPSVPPVTRLELPLWVKAVALATLLTALLALVGGVEVGLHGDLGLSNALAALAVVAMAAFAGLNLVQERALASRMTKAA